MSFCLLFFGFSASSVIDLLLVKNIYKKRELSSASFDYLRSSTTYLSQNLRKSSRRSVSVMELLLEINYIEVVEVSSNQVWLITLYLICLCTDASVRMVGGFFLSACKSTTFFWIVQGYDEDFWKILGVRVGFLAEFSAIWARSRFAFPSEFLRYSFGEVPMRFLWSPYEVPMQTGGKLMGRQLKTTELIYKTTT